MPISVVCDCGRKITVDDGYAGKSGKCQQCGRRIRIPAAIPMSDVVDVEEWDRPARFEAPSPEPIPATDTSECPYCGEAIKAIAKKCKHCGEFLDAGMRGQSVIVGAGSPTPQIIVQNTNVIEARRPAFSQAGPEWNPGIAALLSFFIPGAGQMYKGQVGQGVAWLIGTVVGYVPFILPGFVIHLLCIISAATGKPGR